MWDRGERSAVGGVRVVRLRGDRVMAELACRPVPTALRPLVSGWFGYREDAGRPVLRRQIPGGTVTLFFGFGTPPALHPTGSAGPRPDTPVGFLAGPRTSAVVSESTAGMGVVQVELDPLAAYGMFGVPMHEFADGVVDLVEVLGRPARELPGRLAAAPDWPARFALIGGLLADVADRVGPVDPAVRYARQVLLATGGRAPVGELADAAGCSRRHLARRFRQQLGLTPKGLARVVRLRQAVRLLQRGETASLSALAARCGYYDQAHLNLDFRAVVGCSPTALLAEEAALRARLTGTAATAGDVPFFQDHRGARS